MRDVIRTNTCYVQLDAAVVRSYVKYIPHIIGFPPGVALRLHSNFVLPDKLLGANDDGYRTTDSRAPPEAGSSRLA